MTMRIVFVGTVIFSRHCLREVFGQGRHVVGVFTLNRQRAGSYADYADLTAVVADRSTPVYQVADLNAPEIVAQLAALRPDVVLVCGWPQLIGPAVLRIPSKGCIGSHPTLLPRHRGHHPLIWALVEGLSESGLTFFYMNERVDSGDILWQRAFPITSEDDASTLYRKIMRLASEGLCEFLPQLERGTAPRRAQEPQLASYWRRRTEQDGEIQWRWPAQRIYNLIRGLTHPYVGAHTFIVGQKLVVWRSRPLLEGLAGRTFDGAPGTVITREREWLDVQTGDGILRVLEYTAQGARQPAVGDRLGEQGERLSHLCPS